MSTTQHTPKASRKMNRRIEHNEISRSAMSENEAYVITLTDPEVNVGGTKHKQKRKSKDNKKSNTHHDTAIQSDGPSQRNAIQVEKIKATPSKQQAYAGPTFHQSPAASALPIPKNFLARSLPNVPIPNSPTKDTGSSGQTMTDRVGPERPEYVNEPERQTTPLDFLFDAARKAQTTPRSGSPYNKQFTPAMGSPAARSPAVKDGDTQFPFEFGSAEPTPTEEGAPLSTPYRDRIEAARSARGTPETRAMGEAERQVKAAALKELLKKSAQSNGAQTDNPFNARSVSTLPTSHNDISSQQHSTWNSQQLNGPVRNGHHSAQTYQYFPPTAYMQDGISPGPKMPGSNLRNIYSPDLGRAPAELSSVHLHGHQRVPSVRNETKFQPGYAHASQPSYHTLPSTTAQQNQEPSHQSTPSAQQLENDLRRMLKIDLATRS